MAGRPAYTVQTIPELRSSGMVVCAGQAAPLRGAALMLYTALAREPDGWYTIMGGKDPMSEAGAISGGMSRVPLGFGFGIWQTQPGRRIVTRNMAVGTYIGLYKAAAQPMAGDCPLPVVLEADRNGDIDLYDVAAGRVRSFKETEIPFIVDLDEAAKWAGQGKVDHYVRRMSKIPSSLYVTVGIRMPVYTVHRHADSNKPTMGAPHTVFRCTYRNREFDNAVCEANWYQLLDLD